MTKKTNETQDTEQPKKRRTATERAADLENEAKQIRLEARRREARLRDKRIPKIEAAITVIGEMDHSSVRYECAKALEDLRDQLVDQAVR